MDLAITLDDYESGPLNKQLYDEMRNAILYGKLKPGQKLPSTRELAESLKVSRITVSACYDQLFAEGYVKTLKGSGTFVCTDIPELAKLDLYSAPSETIPEREYRLSEYGLRLGNITDSGRTVPSGSIDFNVGGINFDALPWTVWKKLIVKHCRQSPELLDRGSSCAGILPLREALSNYLYRARAVKCSPDEILMVAGGVQGVDLCARVLVSPGDAVVVENPCDPIPLDIFRAAGAKIIPVEVDADGLVTSNLNGLTNCKIVCVMPSHQTPTGSILSLQRRLELLTWAQQNNVVIIENDFESELRYGSRPVPALHGLDRWGSVVYVGTFGKVFYPSIRTGYLVLPRKLVRDFTVAKRLNTWQTGILEQHAMADFIAGEHFERHIRKVRTIYSKRRTALVDSLNKHFGDTVTIFGDSAGMHVMIQLETKYTDDQVLSRAQKQGVIIEDGRRYYLGDSPGKQFLLGYGSLTENQIEEGVRRLARAIAN